MSRKNICNITIILILGFIFMFSLNWALENSNKTNGNGGMDKETNSIISDDTLLPNNKIIYIVKDPKSNNILWQFEEKSEALVGKNRTELDAKFGAWGYLVNFTNSKVTLEKESNKYIPNKYVIGSDKDGWTVLYKIDKNGNLNIENKDRDIVPIKIQDMINSGRYSVFVSSVMSGKEYNTRDEAESCLGGIN